MIKVPLKIRIFKTLPIFLICASLATATTDNNLPLQRVDSPLDINTFDKKEDFLSILRKCRPCVVCIRNESTIDPLLEQFFSAPETQSLYTFPLRILNDIYSNFNYLYYYFFNLLPVDQFENDLFEKFFNTPPRSPIVHTQLNQGSGFLVSKDGYIMTNAHVVKDANKLTVFFEDGLELDASFIGSDPYSDIAVIKIEGQAFPYLTLVNSEEIELGEEVSAMGGPFQSLITLSPGIAKTKGGKNLHISGFEDFIQTDATINPENSGGPLVNLDCQVIGINTALIVAGCGKEYEEVGFAVPSNIAKYSLSQIIEKGFVTRNFLGLSLLPVDKDIADTFELNKIEGALVLEVIKNSPADKANIKQGDIILECNETPLKSINSFRNEVFLKDPNTILQLKINRKGDILELPVIPMLST